MKRMAKLLALAGLGLWVGNTSLLTTPSGDQHPGLIAHRGVHQVFAGPDRNTCHAQQIAPPQHGFIENTIPSMRAAFEAGANVVELDVHLTPDGVLAVFHDWTLDCQTDGTGVTHHHSFAALRSLDLSYNYTADGVTFPLRGTGIGMMPSLTQVFEANLGGRYMINFKSRRAVEGEQLAALLKTPNYRQQVFGAFGGGPPTQAAIAEVPGLRGYDRAAIRTCYRDYVLTGWTGLVPSSCAKRLLIVPINVAPWLWGWPHRFTNRMEAAGTTVLLAGPYDGSGFSRRIDDAETLARVPERFDGYIWTDRAELIGPLLNAP